MVIFCVNNGLTEVKLI